MIVATALFPMYQMPDGSVMHGPFWSPPQTVLREAYEGMTEDEIERWKQDPQLETAREALAGPIVYTARPSWWGYRDFRSEQYSWYRNYRLPPNKLLWLVLVSLIAYGLYLRYSGVIDF